MYQLLSKKPYDTSLSQSLDKCVICTDLQEPLIISKMFLEKLQAAKTIPLDVQ